MKKEKADLLRDKYAWFFKKTQTIESLRGHEIFSDEDIGTYGTLFDNANTNDEDELTNVYKKFSTLPDFISLQPITKEKSIVFYLKYDFGLGDIGGNYQTIFSSDPSVPVDSSEIPEITISIASKYVIANSLVHLDNIVPDVLTAVSGHIGILANIRQDKMNSLSRWERMKIASEMYADSKMGGANRDIKFSIAGLETHLICYVNPGSFLARPIVLSPCEISGNDVSCYLDVLIPKSVRLITTDNPYTDKIEIEEF
jgi:hypothetical protein